MLWELIGRLANTCLTFRLSGEPGVGKEAIARLIFRHYPHAEAEFVIIDCATLQAPKNTSNATKTTQAAQEVLNAAVATPHHRALYFDNIHCMPDVAQLQLIHLLKQGITTAPPWIFGASIEPLELLQNNPVDPDLTAALDTVHIAVPPLRDHAGKIPQILSWYLNTFSKENPDAAPIMPDSQNLEQLLNYKWPGNLRQLQAVAWLAFNASNWDAAIASLDNTPVKKNWQQVDELAAVYLMSLAKLSIRREKIIENLIAASNKEDIGLLDLAIYNEAVSQIQDHFEVTDHHPPTDREAD